MFGEIESHAQMHIDDGIVTGSVTISDETFHIEVSMPNEQNVYNDSYKFMTESYKLTRQYNERSTN